MKDLLQETLKRSLRYLESLPNRRVAPSPEAVDRLKELDYPLPDQPTEPKAVLRLLDDFGSPATVATTSGRFFGFVVGGSLPAAQAANWLAGAWDQNAGMFVLSPIGAALEQIALKWLTALFGLPAGTGAGFVTGATMANFSGLAAARHALLKKQGWDVESQGLFNAPPITVVVGEEVHVSVLKALSLLGLGRDRVIRVPVDGQGRMRAEAFPQLSGPTIVCVQAGNVNTGAFDPAGPICAAARAADAWVHVDGAFGLWAATTPQRSYLLTGFEKADSWATDAHKWLNVPQDSGLVFCRKPELLRASMSANAAYLVQTENREPSQHVPEMSRRARGLEIWAALLSLGQSGLADMIERTCRHAERFATRLQKAGYEILNDVVLNQVLVSFGNDQKTLRVIENLQAEGTCWCGATTWQGRTAMRISISSWATTDQDVDRSLKAMLHIASLIK
ncbi:MAG: aspartate aminotransferase family protein [Desulfobacteraceae bacterium]|nr:MAG: aspartate aminotransferase family protein [Desulfobacteraceae bacterium]